MMIQSRDEDGGMLSEDDLIGHTFLLYAASHETSSAAASWTLFLLSQHPQILVDLVDELNGVLKGDPPALAQLAELHLLERVIKESLRILPPIPLKPRVAVEDTELGNYFVPAGTEIVGSVYAVHHSPEIYTEPERFNPDRWLTIDPDPFEYHPFGAGPRMCIGGPFAMMSLQLVLSMLLQRYRFEFVRGTRVNRKFAITLSPRGGILMNIHPQDRQLPAEPGGVRGNIHKMVQLNP
jgi:cytochrome P450